MMPIPPPDPLALPLHSERTFWTLGRDSEGFFIAYDGAANAVLRVDSPGMTLMVAWRLGMPGPRTADDADRIMAEKEAAEIEALEFLQDRVGQRGPQA